MKKIIITGSEGVVGTVLQNDLPYNTTDFDLLHCNAKEYAQVYEKARGHDISNPFDWQPVDSATDNF